MKKFYISLVLILMIAVISCENADKKVIKSDPIIGKWQIVKLVFEEKETKVLNKRYLLLSPNHRYSILKESLILEQGSWAKKQGFLVTWWQKGGSTFSLKIIRLDAKIMVLENVVNGKTVQTHYKKAER